jgi:cell division protein FtsQ
MDAATPIDIRLMNRLALALLVGGAVAGGLFAFKVMIQQRWFDVARIQVSGDTQHNSAATLRANVLPRLKGNFFTLDLLQARLVFETVPWVRTAVVQRDFPNRLKVKLIEHVPAAFFGPEGESRLVNSYGEVFDANPGDAPDDLPRLLGDAAQSKELLTAHIQLNAVLKPYEFAIDLLELTPRGSWHAELDNGATVELGRGELHELVERLQRFAASMAQSASQVRVNVQDLDFADLRYANGFAVKWRGVGVSSADTTKKP